MVVDSIIATGGRGGKREGERGHPCIITRMETWTKRKEIMQRQKKRQGMETDPLCALRSSVSVSQPHYDLQRRHVSLDDSVHGCHSCYCDRVNHHTVLVVLQTSTCVPPSWLQDPNNSRSAPVVPPPTVLFSFSLCQGYNDFPTDFLHPLFFWSHFFSSSFHPRHQQFQICVKYKCDQIYSVL